MVLSGSTAQQKPSTKASTSDDITVISGSMVIVKYGARAFAEAEASAGNLASPMSAGKTDVAVNYDVIPAPNVIR